MTDNFRFRTAPARKLPCALAGRAVFGKLLDEA